MSLKIERDKHNHHKQPEFYLKGFSTKCGCPQTPKQFAKANANIWVYRKGQALSKDNPKCKGISNVALAKNFYAFAEEDGNTNFNKYENLLMKDFEQPANPVIDKIRKFEEINEDETRTLLIYIASMVTRGDWWKSMTEKIDQRLLPITKARVEYVASEVARIAKELDNEQFSNTFNKDFFEKYTIGEIEKKKKGEYDKEFMIKNAKRFANELLPSLSTQILIAPNLMPFLTSDNPVCYTSFKNPDVKLVFPISSQVCFLASRGNKLDDRKWKNKGKGFWQIDDKTLEEIRGFVVRKAIKEVYFSKKADWLITFLNNRLSIL